MSGARKIWSRDGGIGVSTVCIRLLGVGFTDGFFTFSCWGDRRRLMAYLAAAAVPRQEYELGCAKDMGRVLVLL